ncbi:MAG TPA: hypothetical protein VFR37_10345 [Longimicrobium sp.]|nr:hypothetical protein [Longimicrobium sp.]
MPGFTLYGPGLGDSPDDYPIGGTDPGKPPDWSYPGYGWWEFINGAWRWISDPSPKTVKP